jgi:hypothetical protein
MQIMHPANILVDDLAGKFQFIAEALDGLSICCNLGPDELESHLFFDLGVKDLIDFSHSPFSQLFDDLVTAGKRRSGA